MEFALVIITGKHKSDSINATHAGICVAAKIAIKYLACFQETKG